MNESVFGEAPEPEREPRLLVVWPLRPVNQIEWSLQTAMGEALACIEWRVPAIFLEDDGFFANGDQWSELYGEELTANEALALQGIVNGEVTERYRRQLIVARECGERATMAGYLIACEAEGIEPILKRSPT
jgi:hypothetical protein